jgi:16S rRNA (guanine527-N7)-methyltransferase
MSELENLLLDGSKQMKIELNESQSKDLLSYVELIIKWNKTYNLSAITNPSEIITKHLLDSLSILNYIDDRNIIDVGSGAGLPGIVLAIMKPNTSLSVIDSVGKKCRFMQFVKSQLRINNLNVINERVESYNSESCYGQIISRAFSGIENTIKLTKHILCSDGQYLFMKGSNFEKEKLNNINFKKHKIFVPYVSDKRYLIQINKKNI